MKERAFGLGVFALGAIYLLLGRGLAMQTLNGPGPGVFPVVVGAALLATGVLAAWRPGTIVMAGAQARAARNATRIVFAALVVLCLVFQGVGYPVSGVLLMTAVLRAFKASWFYALAISALSVLATYLVFVTLLGLKLPTGAWMPW